MMAKLPDCERIRREDLMSSYNLTHLKLLEAENIYIIREVR